MGDITDQIDYAFRDFNTDGVAASGDHEILKSDVREVGPLIESAIANTALGALVSVAYATKAGLDADLAHDAGAVAVVYADASDSNNDLYVKTGVSGAGGWTNTGIIHGSVDALAQQYADLAQAWAEGTLPGGAGTKSAKEFSEDAAGYSASASSDAATAQQYADIAAAAGLTLIASCLTGTKSGDGNIVLSGEQVIGGITTSASRVLLGDQTTASQNGIWVTAAGAWTRAVDFDSSLEVVTGSYILVTQGTNKGAYVLTTTGTITVGTTSLTFRLYRSDGNSSPSELDNKPIEQLLLPHDRARREHLREFFRRPDRTAIDSMLPIAVGERRNLWGNTENLASAYYSATNLTKQTDTLVVDGITLTRATTTNFYGGLLSNVGGLGLSPFTVGNRYLVSCFVLEVGGGTAGTVADDPEKFCWMRGLANTGSAAHGPKMITNRLRRIWCLGQATSTTLLDFGANPAVVLGGGAGASPQWFFSGQSTSDIRNIYIGGFQIEDVGDATYKDGIAAIGDSTVQGASGSVDLLSARETMGYLAAMLNVPTCNRAIGGQRLDEMDARWATDITPLFATCADVIIQGGINDIGQGYDLTHCQTYMASMVSKAISDGFRPIVATCTPSPSNTSAMETIRIAFNEWIRTTYSNVLDFAAIIEDPFVKSIVRNDPDWIGSGPHYTQKAKRALAAFCAAWPHWNKKQPSPYQANSAAATSWTPPASVVRGSAGVLLGQRTTGWGVPTGTLSRTALAAYAGQTVSATPTQAQVQAIDDAVKAASQHLAALINDLHASGASSKNGIIGT